MNKRLGRILASFLKWIATYQIWRGDSWIVKANDCSDDSSLDTQRAIIYHGKAQLWYHKAQFTLLWAHLLYHGIWPFYGEEKGD